MPILIGPDATAGLLAAEATGFADTEPLAAAGLAEAGAEGLLAAELALAGAELAAGEAAGAPPHAARTSAGITPQSHRGTWDIVLTPFSNLSRPVEPDTPDSTPCRPIAPASISDALRQEVNRFLT
ncbi:MAG TPA: hypothetical protein VIR57_08645 [Chloroflexota bacterium]|jgi:hypothetical protein